MNAPNDSGTQRRKAILWRLLKTVLLVLPWVLAGWLFFRYAEKTILVAFADEQTQIFEEMRARALQARTPGEASGYLEYAVNYYPSGTKQDTGTRLDRMVERARQANIREMIAHLRVQTGQDLGDDPGPWIARFANAH